MLSRRPWLREVPLAVGPVRAEVAGARLLLRDAAGEIVALPAGRDDEASWRLLALAAGVDAVVFGNMRSGHPDLTSVWTASGLHPLKSSEG